MRLNAICLGFLIGFVLQIGVSQATDRLQCQSSGQNPARITISRTLSPGLPSDFELLQASLKSPDHHLNTTTTIRRKRTRSAVFYEDVLGPKTFRLIIKNPMGSHLMAEAVIDDGKPYEIRLPQLHCMNEGTALPPAPPCPAGNVNHALLKAAHWGSVDELALAIECGANANAADDKGCSALQIVSDLSCGYSQNSKPSHPSDPNAHESPRLGSRESHVLDGLLKALLEAGANVDSRQPGTARTPLMNLVLSGSISELDLLLEKRADVDAQDTTGKTALMHAAERGNEVQIRTILPHSPNLHLKDRNQMTAFELATAAGYSDLAQALLVPRTKTETIAGSTDGTCSPSMVHIYVNEEIFVRLTAPANAMFLLTAPDLGIELMAMPNQSVDQKIKPTKVGTFPFTCGVHGSAKQTQGSFMVM